MRVPLVVLGGYRRDAGNLNIDGCVKIEGSAIGQVGVSVTLGTLSVTFESWIAKDGEPNEYVGFTPVDDPPPHHP